VAQDLFGNRSAPGELATSRLLTVAETCDLQRLSILAYLSTADRLPSQPQAGRLTAAPISPSELLPLI
jgi:hypothetical protein